MAFVTIDLETFYSDKVSLGERKLTTEEYIRHPEFHVIGMGIKVDDEPTKWVSGDDAVRAELASVDWSESAMLCHNTLFDGAVLAWHFGVVPAFYYDTLCMANALHGIHAGGSLAALATRYELGEKGTEVVQAKNKRLQDFTSDELARYGDYCINDVELTYALFNKLARRFPEAELNVIDMTLRMYTQPSLMVDVPLLNARLQEIYVERTALLSSLYEELGESTEEAVQKILRSNPKFADVLRARGVTPPVKISATTGKETYAFAKTDDGFLALQEHPDPVVQQLCAVRLGTKSTLEEKRIKRFMDVADRNYDYIPVPLRYYGAHTGRFSGADLLNFQNLPSRDKTKKALKNSLVAPPGHKVINCDSSQIEARVLAWLAGQHDVVEQFANGEDVYSIFASKIYKRTISKADPIERFVGKTCIAEGSLVLTDRGLVPIEDVKLEHRLWDGVEWVTHEGVIYQGQKDVITYQGLTATEDHGVFTERGPVPFGLAASRMEKIIRTGAAGETVRVSQDYIQTDRETGETHLRVRALYELWRKKMDKQKQSGRGENQRLSELQSNQVATLLGVGASVRRDSGKVQQPKQPGVQALRGQRDKAELQFTDGLYLVGGAQSATQGLCWSGDRQDRQQRRLQAGQFAFSYQTGAGEKPQKYGDGVVQGATDTYGGFSQSVLSDMDEEVNSEFWVDWRADTRKARVYDILNAGPRRRFTVSNTLVLNCVLGLGYGTGKLKLQHTLRVTPPGAELSEEECGDIVNLYRTENDMIVGLWREAEQGLRTMMAGATQFVGEHRAVKFGPRGIQLPSGLHIPYPNLRIEDGGFVYDSRKGPVRLWGGATVENFVQGVARCVVVDQMMWIIKRYRPVLTVHDSVVLVVPDEDLEDAIAYTELCMSTAPSWAKGLPVACETGYGQSYGDC